MFRFRTYPFHLRSAIFTNASILATQDNPIGDTYLKSSVRFLHNATDIDETRASSSSGVSIVLDSQMFKYFFLWESVLEQLALQRMTKIPGQTPRTTLMMGKSVQTEGGRTSERSLFFGPIILYDYPTNWFYYIDPRSGFTADRYKIVSVTKNGEVYVSYLADMPSHFPDLSGTNAQDNCRDSELKSFDEGRDSRIREAIRTDLAHLPQRLVKTSRSLLCLKSDTALTKGFLMYCRATKLATRLPKAAVRTKMDRKGEYEESNYSASTLQLHFGPNTVKIKAKTRDYGDMVLEFNPDDVLPSDFAFSKITGMSSRSFRGDRNSEGMYLWPLGDSLPDIRDGVLKLVQGQARRTYRRGMQEMYEIQTSRKEDESEAEEDESSDE